MTAAAAGRAAGTGTTVRSSAASMTLAQRQQDTPITGAEWERMQAPAETARGVAKPVPPAAPAPKPAQSKSKPRSSTPTRSPEPPPATPQATTGGGLSLPPLPRAGSKTETAGGFVLGLLFWAWIALPYLKGGLPEVRKTIKAKFTNKAPDGSWLP